jgi:hypothetical protein
VEELKQRAEADMAELKTQAEQAVSEVAGLKKKVRNEYQQGNFLGFVQKLQLRPPMLYLIHRH